jgi:flagellar biogenesis protein FliO
MAQLISTGPRKANSKLAALWVSVGLLTVLAGFAAPELFRQHAPEAELPVTEAASTDKVAYTPPMPPEMPDVRMLLLRLGGGTVLVLGLCVATLWIGKRWLVVGPTASSASGNLRIVDSLSLGNHCLLQLVQAGNQQVLVGLDRMGMKALVPVSDSFESTLHNLSSVEASAGVGHGGPSRDR